MPYQVTVGTNVLRVGVSQAYATLSSALAASRDGDVLLVDAGTYTNDFSHVGAKVSIIGVGGMVNLVATVPPTDGKAILTIGADTLIRNVSFSGARVPDLNGAGIRYEGGNLTLQNCSFHDNENGLMSASVPNGTLLIQHCDFGNNGNGNGLTHNLYAGGIKQLTIEDSRFHGAVVGHEIKSRAVNTTIIGNVISDGPDGTASYSIDLPNGGNALIRGNLIEKGPLAENQSIIHYGGEAIPYAGSALRVEGNLVFNDRGPAAVAVLNQTAIPAVITGNSFANLDTGRIAQGPARIAGNSDGNGAMLPDAVLSGVLPGRTQVFTDDMDHQVALITGDSAVQGGAGRLRVQAVAGHVIVQGGTGGLEFSEGPDSGGNQVSTAEGSSNTVILTGQDTLDSRGTDAITTGRGNVTAQLGGTATVAEGTGNNQWSVLGDLHLTGTGGAPHLTLGDKASATLDGALVFLAVQSNGGTARYDLLLGGKPVKATLAGGAFTMYGSEGRISVTTGGGPDGVDIRLGAGDVGIVSHGQDRIWAGPGDTMVQVWDAADIHAGTGTLSVYSRGWSGATVWGNGRTTIIGGDTGGITYQGGEQASSVQADLSRITLLGGAGHMRVQAGCGQEITGGQGGLTVTETAGSGANRITTQAGSLNTVSLTNGRLESWGRDTVTQPDGNNFLAIHGDAVIQGSKGNSSLVVSGHAVLAGRGGDWVTVQAGGRADVTAGTYLYANSANATLSVIVPGAGAAATALIQGTASVEVADSRTLNISTRVADGGTAVTVDGGTSQIWSYGQDRIHAGVGVAKVFIGAAGTEVWGGSGQLAVANWDATGGDRQTIHGGDGAITVEGGYGDITFIGGAGTATLDGAGRHLTIQGGSGDITVANPWAGGVAFTGGSGNAVLNLSTAGGSITLGSGNTVVHQAQWSAPVTYTVTGGGTGSISGFRPGTDILRLTGVGLTGLTVDGDGTTLTTAAGGRITMAGITAPILPVIDPAPTVMTVPSVSLPIPQAQQGMIVPSARGTMQAQPAPVQAMGVTNPALQTPGPATTVLLGPPVTAPAEPDVAPVQPVLVSNLAAPQAPLSGASAPALEASVKPASAAPTQPPAALSRPVPQAPVSIAGAASASLAAGPVQSVHDAGPSSPHASPPAMVESSASAEARPVQPAPTTPARLEKDASPGQPMQGAGLLPPQSPADDASAPPPATLPRLATLAQPGEDAIHPAPQAGSPSAAPSSLREAAAPPQSVPHQPVQGAGPSVLQAPLPAAAAPPAPLAAAPVQTASAAPAQQGEGGTSPVLQVALPGVAPAPTQPAEAPSQPIPPVQAPTSSDAIPHDAPVAGLLAPDATPPRAGVPAQPSQPAPAFSVIATGTGAAGHSEGEAYAGPVTFLQRQFIWSGDGGVAVAAGTPDVFLRGGSGDDALAAQAGDNVLDGGAGSNFLVGGTGAAGGADTFFLDGRGGQTWSTLVNFHRGDALTVWGFTPETSTLTWAAGEGADGYRGATLHSEMAGAGTGVSGSATFAGLTLDDIGSKVTTTSGTVGGLSYLNMAYTG